MKRLVIGLVLILAAQTTAQADLVIGGQATVQLDTSSSLFGPTLFGSLALNRFYGTGSGVDTATGDQIQAGIGGGVPLTSSGVVDLTHSVNGALVTNPDPRRGRQATTADIDTTNAASIAASWSPSEQVGIDGVTRFEIGGSPFVVGDFAVTYNSTLNRLTLLNNFDFRNSPTFYVENPTFLSIANGFSASGALRIDAALGLFGYNVGDDVGSFSLNAITAVPEPSSALLLAGCSVGFAFRRMKPVAICRSNMVQASA